MEVFPIDRPLDEFLVWLINDHRRHLGILKQYARWESRLFHFTRQAKAHPELCDLSASKAFAGVERVLKGWLRQIGRPKDDPWRAYLDIDREDASAEFVGVWQKVRYLPGQEPLLNAADEASVYPLNLDAGVMERRSFGYPRFVSLAGWLQVVRGAQPILLPVEAVSNVLDVDAMTVSRYRQWAITDGFLREVRAAEFKGKGRRGRAAEFVFNVACCKLLADRAARGTVELFQATAAPPKAG